MHVAELDRDLANILALARIYRNLKLGSLATTEV
jgi:hypothetical protein